MFGSQVPPPGYFEAPLAVVDPEIADALAAEKTRQQDQIELIASENLVSAATLEALGSVITNKTVEGYPGRRYYGGAENADVVERLAIERAKDLFDCGYANVQPHSGSQANLAVYVSLLEPGDTVLSMDLSSGGHLSHGSPANISGKWMNTVSYGLDPETGRIDYRAVATIAREVRPKLIIAGGSAYPRAIDFTQFRQVADDVGATLLVDMAHFAGLVAAGIHPSPMDHAHVVTATTYKNLRGARGGLILAKDPEYGKQFNRAVFPGVQGSVMLNAVAAKAVCLKEAQQSDFEEYARRVLGNARALAAALIERGVDVVSGGTDTPIVLVDLRSRGVTGAAASDLLEEAGLTANKNGVPGDTQPPTVTSGLRFGSSAGTARGFGPVEFSRIGHLIADVLDAVTTDRQGDAVRIARSEVRTICRAFPIYP
ncbi:MAG: serine hydroxymethyltransferase [Actinomycetota bacterium]|nr:serine hydroxymethyltransferase [Actinomycetota bacterium]